MCRRHPRLNRRVLGVGHEGLVPESVKSGAAGPVAGIGLCLAVGRPLDCAESPFVWWRAPCLQGPFAVGE